MKKIPGVFDPWRQGTPVLDETPARKTPTDFSLGDAVSSEQHCVQFNGLRAGLFVWLVEKEDEDFSSKARQVIVELIHRLSYRDGISKILHGWGVYVGTPRFPEVVVIGNDDKKITIVVAVNDERLVPRAVDTLSLALREISEQFPDVRDTLVALKVRPYVK